MAVMGNIGLLNSSYYYFISRCSVLRKDKTFQSLALQLRLLTSYLHMDLENVQNRVGHGTRLSPNAALREPGHAVCAGQGCK